MPKPRHTPLVLIVAVLLVPFIALRMCSRSRIAAPRPANRTTYKEGAAMSFTLVSPAFPNGEPIAARYTCDGADLSPALAWSEVPAASQSLALIADDPDAPAGTWTHWLLWNIPARATLLAENAPKIDVLDNGARQGINDFQRIGYGASTSSPAPPAPNWSSPSSRTSSPRRTGWAPTSVSDFAAQRSPQAVRGRRASTSTPPAITRLPHRPTPCKLPSRFPPRSHPAPQ